MQGDTFFATEISQIYRQTNVKVVCTDDSLLRTFDLIEVELAARSHGSGKSKPVCQDYMTDTGCSKGGQCSSQHPPTNGRCLRCGATKHSVARPRKDAPANPAAKAKGQGKGPPLPKAKAKQAPKGGGKDKSQGGGGGGGGGGATNQQAQPKGQAKKRAQSQPKSKPKAKTSSHQSEAEAGLVEVDWAGGDLYDPPTRALGPRI